MADAINDWETIASPGDWEDVSSDDWEDVVVTPKTVKERSRLTEFGAALVRGEMNVAAGLTGTAAEVFGAEPQKLRQIGTAWGPLPTEETQAAIKGGLQKATKKIQSASTDFEKTRSGPGGWALNVVGEAIPYMGAALAGGVIAGPVGAATVGFSVEGQNAYDEHLTLHPGDYEGANKNRAIVGSINAALEALQIGRLMKFQKAGKYSVKGFVELVKRKSAKEIAKAGGVFTKGILRVAVEEGLEEFAQEGVSVSVPAVLHGDYPKTADGKPDLWAIGERLGAAALGGAVAGGLLGGAGQVQVNKARVELPAIDASLIDQEESAFNELQSRPKLRQDVEKAIIEKRLPVEGDIEDVVAAMRPQEVPKIEPKPEINVYKTMSGSRTGLTEADIELDKTKGRWYVKETGEDVILDKEASGSGKIQNEVPPSVQEPSQPFFRTTTVDAIGAVPEGVKISTEKYREKQVQKLVTEGLTREDADTIVITPDEYKAELKAQKLAEANITKEELAGERLRRRTGQKEASREKKFRRELRGRALQGLSENEKAKRRIGKEEGRFDRWRQRMDEETGPIGQVKRRLDTIKKKNPSRLARLRQGKIMSALTTAKDKFASYLYGQDRMFQLGRMLDGYDDNGPITTYIIRPMRSAAVRARDNQDAAMRLIRQRLDENDVNFTDLIKTKQYSIEGGINLPGSDMVMIHLISQNENGRRRLENDFSKEALDSVNSRVTEDHGMTVFADAIREYVANRSPVFLETARKMGIDVTPEDAYITLLASDPSQIEDMPVAERFKTQFARRRLLGEEKTKERTKTKASVEFRMTKVLPNMMQGMEHFIEVGPAAQQVDSVLRNKDVKFKLDRATRGQGVKLFRDWMNQTTSGKMSGGTTPVSQFAQGLRRNSMLYVLGNKLLSVVPKQAISTVNAIALRPSLAPGVMSRLAKYGDMGLLHGLEKDFNKVAEKSKLMKNRDWERDMRRTYNEKGMRKFFAHKKLSPFSMRWITYVDRASTTAVWSSAYEKAIVDGMGEKVAIQYADDLISQTQPMGNVEDLPAFFRGNTLEQLISTFMNQPNQNWNNMRHNIWGELQAGRISKPKALQRFLIGQVLTSQILGLISRGRLPEDPVEMLEDFAFYMVTPWYFFGRWGYNAVTGFWDAEESAVSTLPMTGFKEVSDTVRSIKKGDARGIVEHTVGAVGAFTGKIPQQAIITVGGTLDLLAGETDDLRRLYYSKYMLEKNAKEQEKSGKKGGL